MPGLRQIANLSWNYVQIADAVEVDLDRDTLLHDDVKLRLFGLQRARRTACLTRTQKETSVLARGFNIQST
ncbi:MAG: hypothetical protein ACLGIP_06180, partial [Alphaproteobacteria bacterium]